MTAKIVDGVYYEDDQPKHAGVVKVDGSIYYAGSDGVLAVGEKVVHSEMCNGLLKHGTYRFAEDGTLVEGFYLAPKKRKKKHRGKDHKRTVSARTKRILLLCAAGALILLIAADLYFGWTSPRTEDRTPSAETGESLPRGSIVLPTYDEEVFLCTEAMRRFYEGEITLQRAIELRQGGYAPFVFAYELPENVSAVLKLDGREYELDPDAVSLTIDNLMTGRTYDYTVSVTETADDTTRTTDCRGSFTTADTNRFIKLPGVNNTRDIGGYRGLDGRRVREGMIIRGAEIDGLVDSNNYLTDRAAAEPFGFRSDLDLRSSEIYASVYKSLLGDDVTHRFFDSPTYGGIFSRNAKLILRDIFSALADPDNYPMYLHCTHGADRTGTVVFLLQGVLGVSEEDMVREFNLTGLYLPEYASASYLNGIYGGLEGMPGDSVNEKITGFLLNDVGVTQEELDSIRAILLD